jgi:uncharacterized membrane protein
MNGAQIHLLTNHIPVLGLGFSAALTAAGMLRGSDELKKAGLWAFVLAGLSALPAYFSGEGSEEIVEHLPGVTEALIKAHEEIAAKALTGALLLAGCALAALGLAFKRNALSPKAAPALLVLALPVLALMAYAAHLGGLIRHSELRPGAASGTAESGEGHDD